MSSQEQLTREVMERAIRRLNILEYVILGAAALLALLGGALVAWILNAALEVPFRISWLVSSLLLFVVPGGIAYARERMVRRGGSGSDERAIGEASDGG